MVVAVDDPESAKSARLADLLFTGIDVMPAPLSFVVGDAEAFGGYGLVAAGGCAGFRLAHTRIICLVAGLWREATSCVDPAKIPHHTR